MTNSLLLKSWASPAATVPIISERAMIDICCSVLRRSRSASRASRASASRCDSALRILWSWAV